MITSHPNRFIFLLFLTVFCAIASFVYISLGSTSLDSLVQQMLTREQTIVRSGAGSIRSLLLNSANTLNILAKNENIIHPNEKTNELLAQVINNWHDTASNLIALIDLNGNVISAVSNREEVADLKAKSNGRDYFEKGIKLEEGGFYIGKPIIPRLAGLQKKYLIPVSTPVYSQGKIVGLLVSTFYVSDLTAIYLDPLKISNQTDIIILDREGNFLSSTHSEVVGQNLFTYIKSNPFLGHEIIFNRLKTAINQNTEQKFDIVIPSLFTGKLTRTLIASSPINIDNNNWILVITTPVSDALVFVTPFILRHLLIIISIFFVSIFITLGLSSWYLNK